MVATLTVVFFLFCRGSMEIFEETWTVSMCMVQKLVSYIRILNHGIDMNIIIFEFILESKIIVTISIQIEEV